MKERITKQTEDGYTAVCAEKAAARLGRVEDLYERLSKEQEALSAQLASLRAEGKMKSVKFNQLMAKKLTNTNVIALLEASFTE